MTGPPSWRVAEPTPHRAPAVADDWDDHWAVFGDPARINPANHYRTRLILGALGTPPPGSVVADIGSGQGELAMALRRRFPSAEVLGIEYSEEGVRRARAVAAAEGLDVTFIQRDLLEPRAVAEALPRRRAARAVCSEVLEHVDEPEVLLAHAADYLDAGCRLVVTVPGGPRSALDRHIGHRRHYDAASLRALLDRSGFEVRQVLRAGFPFFNLYRLAVVARGQRLVEDLRRAPGPPGAVERAVAWAFDRSFRATLDDSALGWQLVAVATLAGR